MQCPRDYTCTKLEVAPVGDIVLFLALIRSALDGHVRSLHDREIRISNLERRCINTYYFLLLCVPLPLSQLQYSRFMRDYGLEIHRVRIGDTDLCSSAFILFERALRLSRLQLSYESRWRGWTLRFAHCNRQWDTRHLEHCRREASSLPWHSRSVKHILKACQFVELTSITVSQKGTSGNATLSFNVDSSDDCEASQTGNFGIFVPDLGEL